MFTQVSGNSDYQRHKKRLMALKTLEPTFKAGWQFMRILKETDVVPESTMSRKFKVVSVSYKTGTVKSERVLFTKGMQPDDQRPAVFNKPVSFETEQKFCFRPVIQD